MRMYNFYIHCKHTLFTHSLPIVRRFVRSSCLMEAMEICIDIVQRLSLPRYIYTYILHLQRYAWECVSLFTIRVPRHAQHPPLDRELRHPRINLFLETIRVFDVYRKTTIFSARTCRWYCCWRIRFVLIWAT